MWKQKLVYQKPRKQVATTIPKELTSVLIMLGTFTRLSWPTGTGGGAPLAGRWSVTTKAFEVCCWARNLIALCSAVSTSTSSAFLINEDCKLRTKAHFNHHSNQHYTWIACNLKLEQAASKQIWQSTQTWRSGNLGISANISIRAAPFWLNAKYSTARCCISASMQLSYLS